MDAFTTSVGTGHGAPSQQLVFIWQCGHNQRVATGSYATPQKSQGIWLFALT
jgi:hypothetical protein